jgi:MFS superfamily sulfate permease-like transporter
LVNLPSITEIKDGFALPSLSAFTNEKVWIVAITIAVVASIETLLCIEATDKLDPLKRVTDTNRELKAQGVGNLISGLLGGLPMTSVVVRSSANITSGGRTKLATIFHGFLLITFATYNSICFK